MAIERNENECNVIWWTKKKFYTISYPYIKLNMQVTMKVSEYLFVLKSFVINVNDLKIILKCSEYHVNCSAISRSAMTLMILVSLP